MLSTIRSFCGLGPSRTEQLEARVRELEDLNRFAVEELSERRDQVRLLKILANGSNDHPGYRGVYPPRVKSPECQAVFEARQELLRRGMLAPRSEQERKRLSARLRDA